MICVYSSRTKNLIKRKGNEYCFFLEYVNRAQVSWYFKNYVDIIVELFNLLNTAIIFIILLLQFIHKSQMIILIIRKNPIPQFLCFYL